MEHTVDVPALAATCKGDGGFTSFPVELPVMIVALAAVGATDRWAMIVVELPVFVVVASGLGGVVINCFPLLAAREVDGDLFVPLDHTLELVADPKLLPQDISVLIL
jgi:hypothetical protein